MVTAKIPGVRTPCQKRQKKSWGRLVGAPARSGGTASRKAAVTITLLRPKRSAIAPVSGAVMATAMVDTVTTQPTAEAEAPKAFASSGRSGCGANRLRNAKKPASTTAVVRVRVWVRAAEAGAGPDIHSIMNGAPGACAANLFVAQCDHRVHARGAESGDVAGQERGGCQQQRHQGESDAVMKR